MKIEVFAILKDYYSKEFEIAGTVNDTTELKQMLLEYNPSAAEVLSVCRFAVNDEFIDNHFQLKENDTICIIPPSSGG